MAAELSSYALSAFFKGSADIASLSQYGSPQYPTDIVILAEMIA